MVNSLECWPRLNVAESRAGTGGSTRGQDRSPPGESFGGSPFQPQGLRVMNCHRPTWSDGNSLADSQDLDYTNRLDFIKVT